MVELSITTREFTPGEELPQYYGTRRGKFRVFCRQDEDKRSEMHMQYFIHVPMERLYLRALHRT